MTRASQERAWNREMRANGYRLAHPWRHRFRWWFHNLVAHPLLVLCPPIGERLHDRTEP